MFRIHGVLFSVLCSFLALPASFLCAAEENAATGTTATSTLDAITADIGDIIEKGAAMGSGDAESIIERIDRNWEAFADIYGRDPWHQGIEIDSAMKAAAGMLAQAKTDMEKKDVGGAAETYAGAVPLLETLILEFNKPVLADFTGAQCKICKIMKARLAKIDEEYSDRVRIILVNVNTQKELTKQYQIMLIPTLVFIDRGGKEMHRNVGEMEEKAVKTKLDELLNK
ncbi:MAG TPA: thioredoxin family protein [bacterium]